MYTENEHEAATAARQQRSLEAKLRAAGIRDPNAVKFVAGKDASVSAMSPLGGYAKTVANLASEFLGIQNPGAFAGAVVGKVAQQALNEGGVDLAGMGKVVGDTYNMQAGWGYTLGLAPDAETGRTVLTMEGESAGLLALLENPNLLGTVITNGLRTAGKID
jgi:hypothetical protein